MNQTDDRPVVECRCVLSQDDPHWGALRGYFASQQVATAEEQIPGSSDIELAFYETSLESAQRKVSQVRAQIPDVHFAIRQLNTQVWQNPWEPFQPFATSTLMIGPRETPCPIGKTPLFLEPRGAFGTGEHATTRALLSLIEGRCQELRGRSFLDVGTGTGILAIAAALWGCQKVVATDLDETILEEAKAHATENDARISFYLGSELPARLGQFDAIACNILPPELDRLIPQMLSRLRPAGRLFLAGIHLHSADRLFDPLRRVGLVEVRRTDERGWFAIELEHR